LLYGGIARSILLIDHRKSRARLDRLERERAKAEQSIATTDIEEHFSILQSRVPQDPIADSFELFQVVAGDGLIATESLINQPSRPMVLRFMHLGTSRSIALFAERANSTARPSFHAELKS
jgi:hypothetical protein